MTACLENKNAFMVALPPCGIGESTDGMSGMSPIRHRSWRSSVGFRRVFPAPLVPVRFSPGCKPVPKLVPARAHKGGETGTVLFSTGQVFSFLSTEPVPGVFDSWEPFLKREPFLGGLSSSFVRSCFPLPARRHSTFRLPFLRRTRSPSSNMRFKTPAMVSFRASMFSLSSRVEIPSPGFSSR